MIVSIPDFENAWSLDQLSSQVWRWENTDQFPVPVAATPFCKFLLLGGSLYLQHLNICSGCILLWLIESGWNGGYYCQLLSSPPLLSFHTSLFRLLFCLPCQFLTSLPQPWDEPGVDARMAGSWVVSVVAVPAPSPQPLLAEREASASSEGALSQTPELWASTSGHGFKPLGLWLFCYTGFMEAMI